MRRTLALLGILSLALAAGLLSAPVQGHHRPGHKPRPTPTPTPPPVFTFADEFDGTTLSPMWGSHILPFPGTENTFEMGQVSVSSGLLRITAVRNGNGWRSGLIDTGGRFEQKFGRFEARMYLPEGNGLWPAWWLVKQPGTYVPEELDILELLANTPASGRFPNSHIVNSTVHWSGGQASTSYDAGVSLTADWHTYGMDWRADHVAFFLDGYEYWRYTGPNIPQVALSPILNLAVGGTWAGPSDATTPSPATMLVDWLRVSP